MSRVVWCWCTNDCCEQEDSCERCNVGVDEMDECCEYTLVGECCCYT